MPLNRKYNGLARRLVIAFDLGTTYSGASYTFLDPGKVPVVETVFRYPGLESKDAAIPTIVYYNPQGQVLSIGVEPEPCDAYEDDDEVLKVEWFKLLLRSKALSTAPGIPTAKLPASKTVVDVFGDFYRYLYQCTQTFIRETRVGNTGNLFWDSLEGEIDFVLSHPNGWGGAQQDAMRRAAVQAGLVTQENAHSRVTFVTEGEASMHFCMSHENYADTFKAGDSFMIIDAGGGTVDLSSYSITSTAPVNMSEIAVSGCIFEGSVIVRQRAEDYLREKLRDSKFGEDACVQSMTDEFDKNAKKRFQGTTKSASITFSNRVADTDAKVGIRRGRLTLSENEMRSFFDPGVDAIITAVEDQRGAALSHAKVDTYFLVGGFAGSEYLFQCLQQHLKEQGVQLYRPATPSSKPVAEGAVTFFVDRLVSTRVARHTYGTCTSTASWAFDNPTEYLSRSTWLGKDGEIWVSGTFDPILTMGTQVSGLREFRCYINTFRYPGQAQNLDMEILAYRGPDPPTFVDQEEDAFATLCTVTAHLDNIPQQLEHGKLGSYYNSSFDVVLSFGLTEFKAELAWKDESGIERRSPAALVYEYDFAVNVSGS